MAVNVLQPGDVVVVISSSGRIDDLLAVAEAARARGAAVVAITGLADSRPEPPAPVVRRAGLGIGAAGPLARLTSHSR